MDKLIEGVSESGLGKIIEIYGQHGRQRFSEVNNPILHFTEREHNFKVFLSLPNIFNSQIQRENKISFNSKHKVISF